MAEKTEAGTVRDFERGDIEAVAQLFQETFRKSKTPSPSLIAYLEEAFFDHPWADPEVRSKVFAQADARVSGFIGVFPSRLELDGRPLRAAFAGSMMVANPRKIRLPAPACFAPSSPVRRISHLPKPPIQPRSACGRRQAIRSIPATA